MSDQAKRASEGAIDQKTPGFSPQAAGLVSSAGEARNSLPKLKQQIQAELICSDDLLKSKILPEMSMPDLRRIADGNPLRGIKVEEVSEEEVRSAGAEIYENRKELRTNLRTIQTSYKLGGTIVGALGALITFLYAVSSLL